MKLHPFAAFLCGLFCVGAMAQSTAPSEKPPVTLKQNACVLDEASHRASSPASTPLAAGTRIGDPIRAEGDR